MLRNASETELLELVRDDIAMAAGFELSDAPPPGAWTLVASRRSPRGDVLLVAGTDRSNAHALAVLPAEGDGGTVAVGIQDPEIGAGANDYLGVRGDRRNWLLPRDVGVLAVAFLAEPGATAIRYRRHGRETETPVLARDAGRCVIVDWDDATPIEGFTAVVHGKVAVPTVLPAFPYGTAFAAESYDAYWRAFDRDRAAARRHAWISNAFYDVDGPDFEDLVVALLKALDARRHAEGLAHLGAGPIYGNGHWFYDRVESDPDIPPENLLAALSMERPEFLPPDVRARHEALMERLKHGRGARTLH